MQIAKNKNEDHMSYACRLNKACVGFELGKLTEEQFKCLLFVCGLKSGHDVDFRTRLLARIEDKADITLQQLSAECGRIVNLKKDSAMIESPAHENVLAVQSERHLQVKRSQLDQRTTQSKPCWACGDIQLRTHSLELY